MVYVEGTFVPRNNIEEMKLVPPFIIDLNSPRRSVWNRFIFLLVYRRNWRKFDARKEHALHCRSKTTATTMTTTINIIIIIPGSALHMTILNSTESSSFYVITSCTDSCPDTGRLPTNYGNFPYSSCIALKLFSVGVGPFENVGLIPN